MQILKGRPSRARHGMSKTPEHRVWCDMRNRCTNPNNPRYADYGGRGIRVCERWRSFECFLEDMGPRPSPDHSIDRRDNALGYNKENCRWATRSEQQLNKRPGDLSNLTRGDDHWTRRDTARAAGIARENISKAHGEGEANPNAKMSMAAARQMREMHAQNPRLTMTDLGAALGVGRETARKVVRGLQWKS